MTAFSKWALLLSFATVVSLQSCANGMVIEDDADAAAVEHRRLIKSRRGLQVDDSWIASVRGSQNECAEIRVKIAQLKAELGVMGLRSANSEKELLSIQSSCIVEFSGPTQLAERVAEISNVLHVEPNLYVHTESADPPSWGLNRIDQESLPLSSGVPFFSSHDGSGVRVYIVDTGLNVNHEEFEGRGVLGADFVGESPSTDGNGHGTHCAGTATGKTFGVAKGATVIGVKVLSKSGSGATSNVISGINWAVQEQASKHNGQAAVISMSLGGPKNQAINDAVQAAQAAGMIVVVAAGNDNSEACNYSPASAGGSGRSMGIISVGSTTSSDVRSSFSNYGSCVDIFAPGSSITSAWWESPTDTKTISGTSMATPHVAGVAAVLLQKHNHDRDAAQQELFALTIFGAIEDLDEMTPNLFLQTPRYTGPPTPPTMTPTMPPTLAPKELCTEDGYCAEFAMSHFGAKVPNDRLLFGQIWVSQQDKMMCSPSSEDFTDKAVIIDRGGCAFYTKVMNCRNQGAMLVIIKRTDPGEPFSPIFFGTDNLDIPSLMIGMDDGKELVKREGQLIMIGSKTHTLPPISPTVTWTPRPTPEPTGPPITTRRPTARPTLRPTKAPTSRPTRRPTKAPTSRPTKAPVTQRPTKAPTMRPTRPRRVNTMRPTKAPTARPTRRPTKSPTMRPTKAPTTARPTKAPTMRPTRRPTRSPTVRPSIAT